MKTVLDTSSVSDPLATREGMIGELFATTKVFPLVLLVVHDMSKMLALQKRIVERAGSHASIADFQVVLRESVVSFVNVAEVEKYRGTVPVFYDP